MLLITVVWCSLTFSSKVEIWLSNFPPLFDMYLIILTALSHSWSNQVDQDMHTNDSFIDCLLELRNYLWVWRRVTVSVPEYPIRVLWRPTRLTSSRFQWLACIRGNKDDIQFIMSDYSKIIHVLCAIKPLVLPKDAFIYLDKEITTFSVSQGPLGVQFTFLYWSQETCLANAQVTFRQWCYFT